MWNIDVLKFEFHSNYLESIKNKILRSFTKILITRSIARVSDLIDLEHGLDLSQGWKPCDEKHACGFRDLAEEEIYYPNTHNNNYLNEIMVSAMKENF